MPYNKTKKLKFNVRVNNKLYKYKIIKQKNVRMHDLRRKIQ